MISIKKKANIITISGHANYSDGEDIVCASVSSIMYTTVNALLRFDDKSISYKDDNNIVTIEILNNTHESEILIINMMLPQVSQKQATVPHFLQHSNNQVC